jgi:apolipoprotein N-acyltransferase
MELKQLTRKDGFWWLISAFLGSIAWITPNTLNLGLSEGSVVILSILSLVLLGAVIGYLRPVKP